MNKSAVGTVLQHTLFVTEILNSRISSFGAGVNVGNTLHFFFRHQKQRVSIFCSHSSSYLTGRFINMLQLNHHGVPVLVLCAYQSTLIPLGNIPAPRPPPQFFCVVKKNVAFICFVCFELNRRSLINSRMLDWLSWCRLLCSTVYPCASMKYSIHRA